MTKKAIIQKALNKVDTIDDMYLVFKSSIINNFFNRIGKKCSMTDFAILLGGKASLDHYTSFTGSTENSIIYNLFIKNRSCSWYIDSGPGEQSTLIDEYGDIVNGPFDRRIYGIRPTFFFKSLLSKEERKFLSSPPSNLITIKYGEYPQYAVSEKLNDFLEEEYNNKNLKKTGRVFTTDSRRYNEYDKTFKPIQHEEYEYKDKKYVRVISNQYYSHERLANRRNIVPSIVWVEVSPIEWYVDINNNFQFISKYAIAAGLRYCNFDKYDRTLLKCDNKKINFWDSDVNTFLNEYFVNEITAKPKLDKELKLDNKKEELDEIIESIEKESTYYNNQDEIKKEIEDILTTYNNEIDKDIISSRSNTITLTTSNDKYDYNTVITKLNEILNTLIEQNKIIKEYYDMLEIVEKIESILNTNEEINNENYLIKMFDGIKSIVFPYMEVNDKNQIINDISNIINKYKYEINDYLNSITTDKNIDFNRPDYKDMNEFEICFRTDIHPILIKLAKVTNNIDLIKSIRENMIIMIENNYKECHDKTVNRYYKNIKETLKSIEKYINKDKEFNSCYLEDVQEILKFELDTSMSREQIYKTLSDVYSKLFKIKCSLEIEENIRKDKVNNILTWKK